MFTIVASMTGVPQQAAMHVYLVVDNWDDWFSYRTMFTMVVFDVNGTRHFPGSVKIGEVGLQAAEATAPLTPGLRVPTLPVDFLALQSGNYFSLGQDENYYETLNNLDADFKQQVLVGLQDCAFDLQIFEKHRLEPAMQRSLLRSVPESNVRNRLNRLAHGNAVLTRFQFEYQMPVREGSTTPPPTLQFFVVPESEPSTNVHVLVGRNGVGKTTCMQSLINGILGLDANHGPVGTIRVLGDGQGEWTFAGMVSVSFSAFDDYVPPDPASLRLRAAFVGLRQENEINGARVLQVKSPADLASDFVRSIGRCRSGPRRLRWQKAVETLSADPLFAEADVGHILMLEDEAWEEPARRFFSRLSSGHAIVLLTTTRLVELVDERTLVVLDEPEGHLHPPLLSAFVRAVADLLVSRNGVAIIATHSPVVLQEVPRSCVWKLRRTGIESVAERPEIETFGENVGVLTREVFGLEVTTAGFHQLVRQAAAQPGATYEAVVARFGNQLRAEGRTLARSLVALRNAQEGTL